MTRRTVTLLAVLSLLVAPGLPVAAARAAAPAATSTSPSSAVISPVLARGGFGRGFGARPSYRYRSRTPYGRSTRARRARPYRPRIGHFFGNALKFLGIAYLFHMMFGWGGGGGSPLGLLLVVAFIAWLVTRRRRRRMGWDARY